MPSQTEHHVGGTKHFECRVNGYPRPTITWYKDGKDITNSSRYNFDFTNDGVISLVIPNITAEDEGHYRCRAENSEGLASTSAYLLVRECRDDRRETTSRSIHSMQIDELIVYRERKKISRENIEQTFETYFETKDKDSNKNIYDEMQNQNLKSIEKLMDTKSELISTSANKFEEESKKISVDMREKKYEIAEKVKSSTLIKEAELQEIQGKVPGKDISSGKTSSQSSSEDEGLILDNSLMFYSSKNVTSSTLASRNSLQQNDLKESKDARLKQKDLEDNKKSTKIDITELHTTDLSTCTEESYIEDVDVIGSESETGSSVDSVVSVDIGISKARFAQDAKSSNTTSFSEMGNVIMEEKNSNVHKTSWVEKLETNEKASVDKYLEDSRPETNEIEFTDRSRNLCASMEKPIIFQTEENVKMEAGKTLKLQARVEAIRPEITWSKDGEKLKDGKRVTMITDDDVYSMTIQHVEESDAGVYRITAINTAGTVYSDFIVNIVAATTTTNSLDVSTISAAQSLQFSIRPDSMAVLENESLKLSCALTDLGKTEAKISWEKNGKMLKNSEHVQLYETQGIYYLEIPKAKYEDAGEYMCVAENNEGRITATVVVNIQGTESSAVILDEQGAEDLLTHAIPSANDGAIGCSLDSSSDVYNNNLSHYAKLFGMAAAFSLVAFGVKKIIENINK
ncbi:muscle M-line assembly protein unc-89-like isoform X2 [Physella acuta]|uniref:muscle M-line assembly protein unc-89-like isoform X2 n=1 Tax=Physella acuta TaxID=109671 RepID=UPI0027DD6A86|nr:muscle M-line assembly protein unc-89-like isoform X2 [Physella acuta]